MGNGSYPRGIANSGNLVYVAGQTANLVYVIRGTTVIVTLPTGTTPVGVAISPDGHKLYVTNAASGTVSVIPI